MSRRMSAQLKHPKKPKSKVKFTDELIFLDCVKVHDIDHIKYMLRRPSLAMDLDKINCDTGLTLLHKAVLENDLDIVQLLIEHKANVNSIDEDSWTPLHAACACGYVEVAKYLLENGANPHALSRDEERPLDVVDPADFPLISLLLNYMREDSDEDPSDEDIMKYRRKSTRKSHSPVPTDPLKLAEFCKFNLTKILNQSQLSLEEMACEIKKAFDDDRFLKSKEFISYLTTIIIESSMSHLYINDFKLNTELLTKKLPLLTRFIGPSNDLELECLYSIQKFDFKYSHPTGLFRTLFDTFFYCSSITRDSFKFWKKNENPYLNECEHKLSLNLLKDFFNF